MAAKKYQVFVSSTFRDLADERQDAIRSILDLNHIPAGMELFPAADQDQLTYIKKVIDECDYYVLIVGGRYGSMDAEGVSYTEREYDYAVEKGMVVLAFVHEDISAISVGKSDIKPELVAALEAFRAKVMSGRLVRTWSNRQNLEPLVLKALVRAFNDMPQVGWIRGDVAANEDVLLQSNEALQENAKLKAELIMLKAVKPQIFENLADLDDIFTVRFNVFHRATRMHDASHYTEHPYQITWKSLFLALANNLQVPKSEEVVDAAVAEAMKEEGSRAKVSSINSVDRGRIKVQFAALGLIHVGMHNTVNGSLGEFLTLTDEGRRVFIELTVTRKRA